jgi:hypothetical protein
MLLHGITLNRLDHSEPNAQFDITSIGHAVFVLD